MPPRETLTATRDAPVASAPVPERPIRVPTLAEMFAQVTEDDGDDAMVAGLPPSSASFKRTPQVGVLADLSRLAKVIALIGGGGSGKTTLARHLGSELLARGLLARTMIAALDPTNRTLTDFFEGVMQPPSSDPAETVRWLRSVLDFIAKQRGNGVLDFGGGDLSLVRLIELVRRLAETLEEEGVGLVAVYMLTPRADDLANLTTHTRLGFTPKATVLMLNQAKAETPAAFDAIRRQPAYKEAIARGAAELWMPALSQGVALRIEQARVTFAQARDGEAPEGRKPASLSMFERVEVREFIDTMNAELSRVQGWLPWA